MLLETRCGGNRGGRSLVGSKDPPERKDPAVPSGKMIAWIVGLALLTNVALEHYKARSGNAAPGLRRAA